MLNKLCLLWQDKETRSWFHVGNLTLNSDETYTFCYELEADVKGMKDAKKNGYMLHPTFPDEDKCYTSSKLFSAFRRRLPNRKRKDYEIIFEKLGVQEDSTAFDLLKLTGGSIHSDSYEFVRPIEVENGYYTLEFFVRGWRHYNSEFERLTDQDVISLEIEEDNPYDSDAVCVLKNERFVIGYTPAFYSSFVKEILLENLEYNLNVEFNHEMPSQYKVKVTMQGKVSCEIANKYTDKVLMTN